MNDSTDPVALSDATGTLAATVGRNIRSLRQVRGVSMTELARRSDVAKGTLSQLELGRGNPTLSTIFSIATALGVTVGELLEGVSSPTTRIVRSGEGVHLTQGPFTARLLDQVQAGSGRLEVFELKVAAAHSRISPGFSPEVVEHVFVQTGRLTVGPVSTPIELDAGDYASYRGDNPHIYETGDEPARAICVSYYPASKNE